MKGEKAVFRLERFKGAGRVLGFGILFLGVSFANSEIFPDPRSFPSFWLPGGLALAVLLLAGKKRWPYFAAMQFGAHVVFGAVIGHPWRLYLVLAFSQVAESLFGAWLASRLAKGAEAFSRLSTSLLLLGAAAIAAPALGASIGLAGMSFFAGDAVLVPSFLSWLSSHALGVLTVSIPVIAWFGPKKAALVKPSISSVVELIVLGAALVAAVYVGYVSPASANPVFRYLVLPIMLWAGIRFPLRVVSLVNIFFLVLLGWSSRAGPTVGQVPVALEMPVIGQVFFVFVFLFDFLPCVAIAGLREAEWSLRLSGAEARRLQEQYQDLLETSQDLIWQCDRAGRFIYLNAAWERTLGYSHGEMIGMKYHDFLDPGLVAGVKADLETLWDKNALMGEEIHFRAKDGRIVLLMCNVKTFRDEAGKVAGARGTAYDMTERHRLEEAVYNAQKQESLGVLAGGLAHDFNNLLGGIYGFIELALRANDIEKIRGYLKKTIAPFERAKDLTHQLLTFSKGGTPAKREGAIAEVLRESVDFALSGRNVQSEFVRLDDLPEFAFDPNQMGQVFQNIAINACDAMPEGGWIRLSVEAVSLDDETAPPLSSGDYARITISDQGPGIPADILSRVFDPFFTTKAQGSGLGLAICYSIVAKHGGSISARSEPGAGTSFIILLPLLAIGEKEPGRNRTPGGGEQAGFRGSGRALVMDDEPFMRDLGIELLRGLGFDAIAAEDADIALSIISRAADEGKPICLAMVDLTVPGGRGGLEAVTELRKTYGEGMRIIAVSGYAENPVMADPKAYGFDGAISKPYMRGDLAAILSRVLRAKGGSAAD